MVQIARYIFLFILMLPLRQLAAQNITGTWESNMGMEYLLLSVEQKGNELCGYTYDYQWRDKNDNCIAGYEGRYDSQRKLWFLQGTGFIKNSGSHVLMRLIIWQEKELGKNNMKAVVYTGSGLGSFLGTDGDEIILNKISGRAQKLPGGKPECFVPIAKSKKPAVPVKPVTKLPAPNQQIAKPSLPKPIPGKSETAKPKTPVTKPVPASQLPDAKPFAKKNSAQKVPPPPVSTTDKDLQRKMNQRKQQQQSRLEINVKRINLKVYDNGIVDNDTVSIFYNGKLLLSHQRLSEQAIELNLDLDDELTVHTITMYAENLGGIPPNTAVVVVTAGDKRYELRSKANLQENAVLVFEYKPKE